MVDHICTICHKRVMFGVEPHHGSTLNHYECEAPRMNALTEKLTYKDAVQRGDGAIKSIESALAKLRTLK